MFELEPAKKEQLASEYGQALYHIDKYDAAIPWLKKGLAQSSVTTVAFIPTLKKPPQGGPPVFIPEPPRPSNTTGTVTKPPDRSPESYGPSFENAIKSECVVLAVYDGCDNSPDIAWNHPACAHYRIYDIPKGPPLNKSLPVKYEFHDRVNIQIPVGWRFSPDKMPNKGSKWILFIENAVPKQSYGKMMFDLFQGSYGAQAATEENMNHLNALLDKYNMRNTHS